MQIFSAAAPYSTRLRLAAYIASALLVAGCSETKAAKSAKFSGESAEAAMGDGDEASLDAAATPPEEAAVSSKPQIKGTSLIKSKFAIDIKAFNSSLCAGEVLININAAITKDDKASLMDVPSALMTCKLIGALDLGLLMKGLTTGGGDGVKVKDGIIHMAALGAGKFTPPHLFMPSFISASREAIGKMNEEQDETVVTKDGKTAMGHTRIETLSVEDTYLAPKINRTFKDVIHFRVTNSGYEGIERMESMLFKTMEFRISLNPLAILSIRFLSQAEDIVVAGARANLPGAAGKLLEFEQKAEKWIFIGKAVKNVTKKTEVIIDMELTEQADLDKNKTIDDGEVIGG